MFNSPKNFLKVPFYSIVIFTLGILSLFTLTPEVNAQSQVSLYPGQVGVFTLKYINAGDSDAIASAVTTVSLNDKLEYVPGFLTETFGGGATNCIADAVGGGIITTSGSATNISYRPRSATTTAAPCGGSGSAGASTITAAPEATPGDQATWPAAKTGVITFRARLKDNQNLNAGDVVNFAIIGETTLDGGSGGAASLRIGVLAVPTTPLVTADILGLTVTCASAQINSTTTCNFTLPDGKTLPSDMTFSIGNSTTQGNACTASGAAVTCTGVPTGSLPGQQIIFGKIGSDAKTDTGEKVNILTVPLTPLVTVDIPGLTVTCASAQINSTTTCNFTLPDGKSLPSDMTFSVGNSTTQSNPCTANGTAVTCTGVPTGSLPGQQIIFGKIGSDAKTDTGEKVNILTVPVVLPRTGGEGYILLGVIGISGLIAGSLFAISRKKKVKVN